MHAIVRIEMSYFTCRRLHTVTQEHGNWSKVIGVNMWGPINGCDAFMDAMDAQVRVRVGV